MACAVAQGATVSERTNMPPRKYNSASGTIPKEAFVAAELPNISSGTKNGRVSITSRNPPPLNPTVSALIDAPVRLIVALPSIRVSTSTQRVRKFKSNAQPIGNASKAIGSPEIIQCPRDFPMPTRTRSAPER